MLITPCKVGMVLQERANCGSPSSTSTLDLGPDEHNQGLCSLPDLSGLDLRSTREDHVL
jgi:hypothetical protein